MYHPAERTLWHKQENLDNAGITDIDSKHKDPLMCSLYAPDIYRNLHATELDRRPSGDYMEKLQRDINPGMRGILIDWLVEVSAYRVRFGRMRLYCTFLVEIQRYLRTVWNSCFSFLGH
ncbi:cyclin-A2-4-like [Olea europaea var. sylvestris]|uniref:cyclin-A2-4-like n=1 Tax=Olea europaea var. sylvestris TaxID=158386 RepID=UPI000C1CE8D7|nr:cyclin-A2-4-like [Olea europaea var. sylvestris]